MINQLVSSCCKAMLVAHVSDEGTGHYTCSKCGEACDQHSFKLESSEQNINEDVLRKRNAYIND